MDGRHYPEISESALWPLKTIATQLKEDPSYLSDPACPYPDVIKQLFTGALVRSIDPAATEAAAGEEDLEENLKSLWRDLKAFGSTLKAGDEAQRVSYFRAATAILEKLVKLQADAFSVKRQKEFEAWVFAFLEDHCTPETRTKMMDSLNNVIR